MLAEEQMDKAWEPSKSNALFDNRHWHWIGIICSVYRVYLCVLYQSHKKQRLLSIQL